MQNIEILDYNGEGYKPAMAFGQWRVAYLNYCERFDKNNCHQLEKHNLTDEVFVLLCGKATLIIGEDAEQYKMSQGKIYNVKKGAWHHIVTSEDAKVLIVENDDTGDENSEYLEIPKQIVEL